MAEKTKQTSKRYVLATDNKRMVNGRLVGKGDAVDVSKMNQADIAQLVRLGIYKEAK